METMEPHYNPKEREKATYEKWEQKGYFNPDNFNLDSKETFSMVLPPPNVTGTLHMGHALNITMQDVLARYHRMKGDLTVWVPGTDHASIGLQSTLEKKLRKEGISRFDLGREKFIEKAWEWRDQYGNIILNQIRAMGASCDWSRLKFTMDRDYVEAVETAFIHYFDKGWVYRGERVVNWCSRCGTSISDLEVDGCEEPAKLWFLKYPVAGQKDKFITVATTRPETMLGDTAVAANPKDGRYKELVGKMVIVPLVNRSVPVIADDYIDQEFGTGAVKVTPAHDLNDWQMGQRHKLPLIQVINERGKIAEGVPEAYRGLKAAEAREKIVEEMTRLGLVEKIEDYTHQIPKCSRCGSVIQLLPSKQWFLKMNELAAKALEAGKNGQIKFHPQRWEETYYAWLEEPRDWCISRQLWWGQRLPVWFCEDNPEKYFAAKEEPKACPICKKCHPKRSEDVFDTWFSSALWPIATMGWPKVTEDKKRFLPTSVLTTGRDIINLWVSRMVFSALELTGQKPFSDVVINAMVLTKDGRRMSKSLGTGVDPMMLIEKYGTDATRFGLAWQVTESQDIHFNEDTMVSGGKFLNKIWNAAKFVLFQLGESKELYSATVKPVPVTAADEKILNGLVMIADSTEKHINRYEFGHAIRELYEFFWHEFCDVYIEEAKKQIKDEGATGKTKAILIYSLANLIKLLHPFMPFVTEEVYGYLPVEDKKDLIVEVWPNIN